jgi:hypothetical protein
MPAAVPVGRRRLFLVFLLYLTVDLTNPFVAGAFSFDPDECVEALTYRASSSVDRADASGLPARVPVVRLARPSPSPVRPRAGGRYAILEWLIDWRAETHVSGDPPPIGDDP